jgi:hypothetical protein
MKGHIFCEPTNLVVTGTLNMPISDNCLVTDQGVFQDLNASQPIVAKPNCLNNYLVYIEKNAFEKNCPSQRIVISKDQKIFYKNKMIPIYKCIGSYFNNFIRKIPYNGETLYNILLKKHSTVRVNNLVCETFNPSTLISQLYATNLLTDKHVNHINAFNNEKHKELKKNTFHGLINKL